MKIKLSEKSIVSLKYGIPISILMLFLYLFLMFPRVETIHWIEIGEYQKISIAGREYTPTGLTEFHLPVNITLYEDMSLPKSKLKIKIKNKIGKFRIEDWGIDYLDTYSVLTPNCTKKYTPWNETIFANGSWINVIHANYTDMCYPYREEKYTWKPVPDTLEFKANEPYIIDLWAYKKPTLGHSGMDVKLKIGNYELTKMSWWNSSYNKKTNITVTVQDTSKEQYADYPINLSFDTSGLDENSSVIRVVNSSGNEIPYILIKPNYGNSSIWVNYTNDTLSSDFEIYYDNTTPMGSVSVPNVTELYNTSGTTFDKDDDGIIVEDLPGWSDTGDPQCCWVNGSWGYGGTVDGNVSLFHKATSDRDSVYTPPNGMDKVGKIEWWQRSSFYIYYLRNSTDDIVLGFQTSSNTLKYRNSTGGWNDTGVIINETDVTHWEIMYDNQTEKWNFTVDFVNGTQAININNSDYYITEGSPNIPNDMIWYTSGGGDGYGHSFHIDNLIIRHGIVEYEPRTNAGIEEVASSSPENEVTLESPADNGVETSLTVNFTYTPIFYNGDIFNCSLYNNETSWSLKQTNTTQVVNNTINGISYTFSGYEIYKWNFACNNTTAEVFASANYTVNVSQPDNPPTVTLTSPADEATETSPVTFQYTPIDDLGFEVAELYVNNTTSLFGSWTNRADLPAVRTDPAGAVVNNIFYVMGGKSGMASGHSDKVWGYNITNNTWTEMASIPIKVEQSAACVVGDSIYLFGGIDAAYLHRLNDSFKYDTTTDTWSYIANFTYNISGSVSTDYNGDCYIASGVICNENNEACTYTPILVRYNVDTNDYTTLTNSSTPHTWGSMSGYDGKLYALDGGSPRNNLTENYSISGNSWTDAQNTTYQRYGLGRTRSNYSDLIFIVGGQYGDPAVYLKSLITYNVTNDTWSSIGTYPDANHQVEGHAHGVVANGSDWYYIFSGGRDGEVPQDYTETYHINPRGEGFGLVANNTTAITNNSANSITYSFPTAGDYKWNIRLTDSGGHSVFAAANRTITVTVGDTTVPIWSNNQTSTPGTYDPDVKSYFNVTWTDETSFDTALIWSNDTNFCNDNCTMVNLGSNIYTYNITLPAGSYQWKSYGNDSSNNQNVTDIWNFSIGKATPTAHLYLNGTEGNKSYIHGDAINITGWIETGDNIPVNVTVYYENASSWAYTNLANWNSSYPPNKSVDDDWETYGEVLELQTVDLYENYTVLDEHGDVVTCINWSLKVNDSATTSAQSFLFHSTGEWYQYYVFPDVNNYTVNLSTENESTAHGIVSPGDYLDRGDDIQIKHRTYLHSDQDNLQYFEGNLSYDYSRIFEIETNTSNKTLNKMVGNITTNTWDNGFHNVTLYYFESENYTNSTITYWVSIPETQATEIDLYLNGTETNQTLIYGDVSNITATINVTGLYVELYRNGTYINNGTDKVENITDINWFSVGTYNITASFLGNDTYQSSSKTHFIFMNPYTSDIELYLNGTRGAKSYDLNTSINLTANLPTPTGQYTPIFRDDVLWENGTSPLYNYSYNWTEGVYEIKTNWTGNENYTSDDETWFLTVITYIEECNATTVGGKACGGEGFKYILTCVNNSGIYEWGHVNRTYCKNGCFEGKCLSPDIPTYSYCSANQTKCGGLNNRLVIPCDDDDGDGYYEWSKYNHTFCNYTCFNGACLEYPIGSEEGFCEPNSTKCFGESIMYCVDEDGDGVWGWDAQNLTSCQYGCIDEVSGEFWNATCLTRPPEYAEDIAKSLGMASWVITESFRTPIDKFFFFLMIIVGVGCGVAYVMGGEAGVLSGMGVMVLGTSIGWIPIYVSIIMTIVGVVLWREQMIEAGRKVGKTIGKAREYL